MREIDLSPICRLLLIFGRSIPHAMPTDPNDNGPSGKRSGKTGVSGASSRPLRVLVAKVGLDGHDRGARIIATSLRDAGMEVIYTGLRQTPEMVVNAALQEDVDAIGISILSGAHMTVFPRIIELMKARGLNDVLLTGGGIIPDDDRLQLQQLGVGNLFPPGTPTAEIADYIREWVQQAIGIFKIYLCIPPY